MSTKIDTYLPLGHLDGYEYQLLSTDPLVYTVSNVLSAKECGDFISRARTATEDEMTRSNPPEVSLDASRLWPIPFLCLGTAVPSILHLDHPTMGEAVSAAVPPVAIALTVAAGLAFAVTQLVRSRSDASSRTSEALALNTERDYDLIHPLVERACRIASDHPWDCFEAPVLTRYGKGAVFATHCDASPTRGSEWADLGGQRVVTVITYLNDCSRGGGTSFDRLGITVQPKQGSSLVFYPADGETLVSDDRTRHESLPAVEEKYIVQMFGRVGRVPPDLGLPDAFGY